MSEEFGPVSDYLPHRPPMILIDGIDEVTKQRCVCHTTIHPDCVFAQDGLVHPSAMIEFVAQVCAIFVGVTTARDGSPPLLGFIVSCREITFAIDNFAVGDELTIISSKMLVQEVLAAFNGSVIRRGETVMTMQLTVVDADAATKASTAPAGTDP